MGLPISTSPDITLLDYAILYDISGGYPFITLTNQSVGNPSGDTNLANCNWWYTVATPGGFYIHEGTASSPDVSAANWTELETTEGEWPTPFGVPPYGQIEFSCAVPYVAKLYVQDSAGNIFSLEKKVTICRPNGNTEDSLGNFGVANVAVTVKCDIAKIYANDTTNYTYQDRFGEFDSNTWKLAYPMDVEGNDPAVVTVEDQGRVIFGVGYSAKGYQLNLGTYATYDMGNDQSIKIQYKFNRVFAVLCNIDLCQLTCEIDKLYKLLPSKCGTVDNPETKDKLLRINTLLGQCFIGINQPLCGIDVPAKIEEIKKIGGFTCNCGVGGGINPIASTDGDINIEVSTTGDITGSVTNVGNNYVIHLAVPGATAGTLQVVTDNGNVTTNSMFVGNVSALNSVHKPEGFRVTNGVTGLPYCGVERIGSDTYGTLFLSNAGVGGGTVYVRPHATTNTWVMVLPQNQGAASQTLINDGAGNLTWGALSVGTLQSVTTAGNTTTNAIYGTGIGLSSVVKSANYTLLETDFQVVCDITVASFTVTLPNLVGKVFTVKLYDPVPLTNQLNIVVSGGGTIDGSASYVLRVANQSVVLMCIGAGLYTVVARSNRLTTVPTIVAGGGLGLGASASLISGTDMFGTFRLNIVTPNPVASPAVMFNIQYGSQLSTSSVIQIQAKSLNAASVGKFWCTSSNQFSASFTVADPTILIAGDYDFTYQVSSTD